MAVDSGFAEWLKSAALFTSGANAGLLAGLQGPAIETEIITPLATKAAADAENARQIAFVGGPNATDRHIVSGQRRDLLGKCVTLKHENLGYSAGKACFVLEVSELEDDTTALTVLRKLP
jgi:hypothetical protein